LINHRFDDALAALRVSLEEIPAFIPTYRTLATCYALMGRRDEARSILGRLTALTPIVQPTVNPFHKPEHRELLASGLRLAAGEHRMQAWAGQSAALARAEPVGQLVLRLWQEAQALLPAG